MADRTLEQVLQKITARVAALERRLTTRPAVSEEVVVTLTIGGGGLRARKVGNLVTLFGTIANGSGLTYTSSFQQVGTLPEGWRPSSRRLMLLAGSTPATAVQLEVATTGAVSVAQALGTAATNGFVLGTYPV